MNIVDNCLHENPILDYTTDTEVCTQCGKVLDNQALLAFQPQSYPPEEKKSTPLEMMMREEIIQILSCLHQDNPSTIGNVVWYLKQNGITSCTSENNRGLMTFAIWQVLMKQGCVYSPKEIIQVANVTQKAFLKAEKTLTVFPIIPPPAAYARRILPNILISPYLCQVLLNIIAETTDVVFSMPEAVVGAVLYFLSRETKRQRQLVFPEKEMENLETIALALNIRSETILRAFRRLPDETKLRIIDLVESNDMLEMYLDKIDPSKKSKSRKTKKCFNLVFKKYTF